MARSIALERLLQLFFPVLIACWLIWFVDWRNLRARGIALAAIWGAASALLVPTLFEYSTIQRSLGLVRTAGEMALFSAKPESFVTRARSFEDSLGRELAGSGALRRGA